MASLVSDFEYDVFISYRHRDNQGDRWVTGFVDALKAELAATFKEDITIYFDTNPHDGISDHHDVDLSVREKVRSLILIPVLSQTYCDPGSFAWRSEFLSFQDLASKDRFGLKVKVASGNVASRILPVRIHELAKSDLSFLEKELGGTLRAVDFIFNAPGINRPLIKSDQQNKNSAKTSYRDQLNKVANAIKEILDALRSDDNFSDPIQNKPERFHASGIGIPTSFSTLFGRDKELEELGGLLEVNRVVTILGPGGIGKTRLAIEISQRLMVEFSGNVVFVPMAALTEAEEVIPALANTIGVKEAEGRNLIKGLSSVIGDRKVLIVLDNLEQVIAVAPQVAELVSNCPNLKILTTSRTPLKIRAEYEYSLAPLLLPSVHDLKSIDLLLSYPSVSLFMDRARKVNASFALTHENAGDVVQICMRLDGLPLALELAAARIRMLTASQLLRRLEHALDVLTGGSKDLPERHQTLRATIEWSHSLLSESEKILFRRMAVFSGGCTLEGIEETCYDSNSFSALEELESLVDKGLVQQGGVSGRFLMLQTIKEYAIEKLGTGEEVHTVKRRQAEYYLKIAARIGAGIEGDDQEGCMRDGILEESNLQSVLDFLLQEARGGNAALADIGMTICGELYMFWHIRGKHIIAKQYTTSFLGTSVGPAPSRPKCLALNTAGIAQWTLGHFEESVTACQESYVIAKTLNEKKALASCTFMLFLAHLGLGKIDDAGNYVKESLDVSRDIGSDFHIGFALAFTGILLTLKGDLDAAARSFDDALRVQSRKNDREGGGISLGGLAMVCSIRATYPEAIRLYKESLTAFASIGDRAEEARILEEMAWVCLKVENAPQARKIFLDSILAYEEIGSVRGIGVALLGIAGVEAVENRPSNAIKIATAAELFTEQEGIVNSYGEGFPGKVYLDKARSELSPGELEDAVHAGKKLSLRETIQLASS